MSVSITRAYRSLTSLALWIILLLPVSCIADAPFTGKVVKIADGDTLTGLVDKKQVKVRLAEIDCPQRAQPWSNKAKQALSRHTFAKVAKVNPVTKDKYRRTVAKVIADGINVNRAMVRDGRCWVYRKYAKDRSLFDLE